MNRSITLARWAGFLCFAVVISGCTGTVFRDGAPDTRGGLLLSGNLSEIKHALILYHDNGQYEKDLEQVDEAAAATWRSALRV